MATTMKDVAKATKVSQATVSMVLNGKAGNRVSLKKQELIRMTAVSLGYRTNMAAKSLKTNYQYSIGILMPIASGFYSKMVVEIQHALSDTGYTGVFAFWESLDDVEQAVDNVLNHGVDGILTWELTESIINSGKPISFYGTTDIPNIDCIDWDFEYGFENLFKYLKKLGHSSVGWIGHSLDSRYECFKKLSKKYNFNCNNNWEIILNQQTDKDKEIKAMLKHVDLPDAFICLNDEIAISTICLANEVGLSVPRDISIIGFDNIPISAYASPRLTTFDTGSSKAGKRMVELLMRRLKDPNAVAEKILLKPELIARNSCSEK